MFGHGNGMLASERPKFWQSKLILASTTIVGPQDVGLLYVDGCAGGSGGAGGNSTPGGGGGGGGAGLSGTGIALPIVPGETLTIVIGAAGLGGVPDAVGGSGGYTEIAGSRMTLRFAFSPNLATAGAAVNGGHGGRCTNGVLALGGAGAGANAGIQSTIGNWSIVYTSLNLHYNGSAGGALNFNAGYGYDGSNIGLPNSITILGGTGGASGGGGGIGGSHRYGAPGVGGSNGAAGTNATGYGAGGGGGSGNAAGGNGSPGFLRLYYLSSYTI